MTTPTPTPKPPRAKRITEPAPDAAAPAEPIEAGPAPQTPAEAVTALLASLDLEAKDITELQVNVKASRVRILGVDRSLRTRSFKAAE